MDFTMKSCPQNGAASLIIKAQHITTTMAGKVPSEAENHDQAKIFLTLVLWVHTGDASTLIFITLSLVSLSLEPSEWFCRLNCGPEAAVNICN